MKAVMTGSAGALARFARRAFQSIEIWFEKLFAPGAHCGRGRPLSQ